MKLNRATALIATACLALGACRFPGIPGLSGAGKAPTGKEMGTVIKAVQAKLQAASLRAEGRAVSDLVKKALAS